MINTERKRLDDLMKRRLTYNGERVYIKKLTSKYALVSKDKKRERGLFKVNIDRLAKLK